MLDPHIDTMLNRITEIGYNAFQDVIALGRWPDGSPVSAEDKPILLQAMVLYEHKHVPLAERTGFIHKMQCQSDRT